MKQSINDASARQRAGGPSPVPGRGGTWNNRPRRADIAEVERQIAGLVDRSAQELWLAWRQLHRSGPPLGLSRDLLIRALAHQLQERSQGGASRALRRRLQSLAGEFEKSGASVRSRSRAEDRDGLGASVARAHSYHPRSRRRLRV